MRPLLIATAMVALAAPALAQSELDRLEVATEAMAANMNAFLISRVPELADVVVSPEWNDEIRVAAGCTLDAIRAEGGDAAVADYIDAMEAFSTVEITSVVQLSNAMPVPVSPSFAARTGETCGLAAIATRQTEESGLMEMMLDPDIAMRIMEY